ncbi:MAG: hypothetical protein ACXABG_15690, partial [Promethearchaeota archaeon]
STGNGNGGFLLFVIIGVILGSIAVSVSAIVVVKKRAQKDSFPRRKKVPLKLILSHIDELSKSLLIKEKIDGQKSEIQKKKNAGTSQQQSISDKELMDRISKIKNYGEKLLSEGAYLEAQKQFEFAEKILLRLGKEEEALVFSDLKIGIKELSEQRDERLEKLEGVKTGIDSYKIFDTYYDLIELSEKLKDHDSADMYLSELTHFFQKEQTLLKDLEYHRFKLYKKANSFIEEKKFEQSVEIYEICKRISQFLVQLGRENEKNNVKKFREKIEECLSKATQK